MLSEPFFLNLDYPSTFIHHRLVEPNIPLGRTGGSSKSSSTVVTKLCSFRKNVTPTICPTLNVTGAYFADLNQAHQGGLWQENIGGAGTEEDI